LSHQHICRRGGGRAGGGCGGWSGRVGWDWGVGRSGGEGGRVLRPKRDLNWPMLAYTWARIFGG
jgi:hypothetical protein